MHHAPARERFTFIHERRDRFSAKLLCRVLLTDGANYRAWVRSLRKRRDRQLDERRLTELIFEVRATHPAYGVLRITRELQRRGIPVGRRIVARLMRENGIAAVTRRRRRNLTRPDAGAVMVPDLICRQFTAPMPGLKLIGDISCFAT
ncbi:MAG TPA: IS3 family transposase [Mycobacterium sp.]|uniref:IS3 family transposase n=1 Tax=Mycobacterium sp. TaxID=1785 RepID=UPI002D432A3C|nr:IS3 family transposase [Mycobacterium sp.]HZU47684.1 IS3 family transposase [Mycobacterium sp.]